MTKEAPDVILSKQPFFRGMPENQVKEIAALARIEKFEKGDIIFREGNEAKNFYIVIRGKIVIETLISHRGLVNIQSIEEGEVMGWSWLVPPYKYRFGARASTATEIIVIDGKSLLGAFEKEPSLGYLFLKRVLSAITERLEQTRLQMLNIFDKQEK
jgi:CRP/FNR family transcriptional regulator, cyclic AMP receptor protein